MIVLDFGEPIVVLGCFTVATSRDSSSTLSILTSSLGTFSDCRPGPMSEREDQLCVVNIYALLIIAAN